MTKELQNAPGEMRGSRSRTGCGNAGHLGLIIINVEEVNLGWTECSQGLRQLEKALESVSPGQAITVIFSNRDFAIDMSAWCQEMGFKVMDTGMRDDDYYFVIKKEGQ